MKLGKILEVIKNLKKTSLKNKCYSQREYEGYAAMGCCGGLVGGDEATEYLQYTCIGCPYYVDTRVF